MDDFYIEQIVNRNDEKKTSAVRLLVITVAVILFLAGAFTGFGLLIFAGLAICFIGLYFLVPMTNVEYEYLYMSKELSVDKIYNKERRKKMGSWDLNNMESLKLQQNQATAANAGEKLFDFTSGEDSATCYELVIKEKGTVRIVFEPNEELLKAIKSQFPRQTNI